MLKASASLLLAVFHCCLVVFQSRLYLHNSSKPKVALCQYSYWAYIIEQITGPRTLTFKSIEHRLATMRRSQQLCPAVTLSVEGQGIIPTLCNCFLALPPGHVIQPVHHVNQAEPYLPPHARRSLILLPNSSMRRQHQLQLHWGCALMCMLHQRRVWGWPTWSPLPASLGELSSCTLP